MSFLLSSFFAVPVSSTMGLPLHWVSSPSASIAGASLSWAPAVLGLFRAKVVSTRLNPSHGTLDVTRVYVPRFFVSSQQRFGAKDIKALSTSQLSGLGQISVTPLFYLEDSRREKVRERARTRTQERVREKALWLLLLCFSSTWACPMQIGLSQECCLFCLES